jgi:hypothetical protein
MESSFGASLGAVRVHRRHRAATAADQLGAKAFTLGPNIVLGSHARPDDLGLMAHEAAHTIQQGSVPVPQFITLSPSSGDAHEGEAQQASAAVLSGQHFRVTGRTSAPRVQRLGVRDALDYFANAANNIPGFSMLTYVIMFNPISMREVPRNAANLFRAIIGFLPGGNLIFEALQRHGILDRVGAWLQEQLATLGLGVRSFREALDEFLGSLRLWDIANPGGVWRRAQRIFTGPIDRLIGFVRGLVGGILGFIRNAILRPVARLAQGTRGYDLLRLVLGQDPITGDPYPRTAENMIGGFMRLIGEEEKWRHLQQSRAIPRAWAWFQEQIGTLMGFVREIPQLFSRLWQGLQISDLLDIGGAFNRARGIFGGFVGRFFSWAGNAALQIMIFIFEALAPRAMPVLRRAASVLGTIVREPVRFVGNLVRAGLRGFEQFRAHIRRHLVNGLVGWLTGALTNAGLQLPTRWDARGVLSLALQILGLTWQNIRVKLVRVMGETAVRALETTFELVVTLVREGPAAAWQRILEHLGNLREMVFDQIRTWVRNTIVGQAVVRILSMLNPAGAVIQAIIAIYDTIIFFRDRLQQISQVAESFFNSIAEIAAGNIGAAANRVEQTMGRLVPVVIGFLAAFMHLGGISGTIHDIIARLRAPIDRALDRVVDWIRVQAQSLIQRASGGSPQQRLSQALNAGQAAVNRFAGRRVGAIVLRPLLAVIRVRYQLRSLDVFSRAGLWIVRGVVNPPDERTTNARVGDEEQTGGQDPSLLNALSPQTRAAIRAGISRAVSARGRAVPRAEEINADLQSRANEIRRRQILNPRRRLTSGQRRFLAMANGDKTVAYIGRDYAISGYSGQSGNAQTHRALLSLYSQLISRLSELSTQERRGLLGLVTYLPRVDEELNLDVAFFLSHAEKMAYLRFGGTAIGVSRAMCGDCRDYFSGESRAHRSLDRFIVVADPRNVHVFISNFRFLLGPNGAWSGSGITL